MINKFDIIYFSETKTDETDIITFPGYCYISQPRKQKYVRKSGGMAVYYKEGISKYIKAIETQSDYILWIELDKCLMQTEENVVSVESTSLLKTAISSMMTNFQTWKRK